jgi:hypothetical protein
MVKEPAEGAGKCAGQWHESRLEYMQCNMRRCKAPPGEALKCKSKLDVILLLDGTPKSGESGWHAEVKAANFLVDAFTITPAEHGLGAGMYTEERSQASRISLLFITQVRGLGLVFPNALAQAPRRSTWKGLAE